MDTPRSIAERGASKGLDQRGECIRPKQWSLPPMKHIVLVSSLLAMAAACASFALEEAATAVAALDRASQSDNFPFAPSKPAVPFVAKREIASTAPRWG
jgi:hypothetical protein